MRAAPPVGVTCPAAGAWRLAQALLAGVVAAVLLAWAGLHLGVAGAGVLACLLATGPAVWVWRRQRPAAAELRWDGQRWTVDGTDAEVDVMLDLGGWLLLRARPAAGAGRWLPLSRRDAGPAWHALRAALFSRSAPPAPGRVRHE